MKTEEKAKKVQNIATALAAIFGAVGAFFGIFQAQMSANLKNQVTSLQNASQQTIVNVISTLGDDAQAADLAQSGDTVAITEQYSIVRVCLIAIASLDIPTSIRDFHFIDRIGIKGRCHRI